MKPLVTLSAILAMAALSAPALRADVKTREKTLMKFEGMMGGLMNRFGGQAAKDGVTSTVAVKGTRLARIDDRTGQIIDLSEEKVYDLDVQKKEYKVTTFAEMRQKMKDAQAEAEKQAKAMKPEDKQKAEEAGKQMDVEFDVKETGQHKQVAGYDAHEAILTVTMHEKGKPIEESGGMIMTTDMWLGPQIPALDEVGQFEMKYFQAIFGDAFGTDMPQMSTMMAMYPGMKEMSAKMKTEGAKLRGTSLTSTTTMESVKSAEAIKAASQQQQQQQSGGGGFGGFLSKKMAGNRGDPTQARATLMTTTRELLSVEPSASAADVAVPAGFKEKK